MNKKTIILFITLFNISYAEISFDNLKLNSFGSLGITHNNSKDVYYKSDTSSKKVIDGTSHKLLTDFGFQLDYSLNDSFNIIYQGYIREDSDDNYNTEYFNLKYSFNQNDYIRIGKMKTPLFMYNGVVNVSNAYIWTHLPSEVYTFNVSNYNALEFSKQYISSNDLITNIGFSYGEGEKENSQNLDGAKVSTQVDKIRGGFIELRKDDLLLRTSYYKSRYILKADVLNTFYNTIDYLSSIDAAFTSEIKNKYSLENKDINVFALGLQYEKDWLISAEYNKFDIKDNVLISKINSYYLSIGYQFGNFSPYVLYGKRKQSRYNTKSDENKINQYASAVSTINPTAGALIAANSTYLASLVNTANMSQSTISIGFRHRLNNNLSLKMQYEKIFLDNKNRGVYSSINGEFSDIDVLNIAISYSF